MPDNDLIEIHKQHRTSQDKYTYFLLAVTASAVAFSVQKTDNSTLSLSMIPLGFAVLVWGISFFFGCQNLRWVQASVHANYSLLQLERGVHPEQPDHPQELELAKSGVRSALESNINKARCYGQWQFWLLIVGVVLFLGWHITEMVLRTLTPPPLV